MNPQTETEMEQSRRDQRIKEQQSRWEMEIISHQGLIDTGIDNIIITKEAEKRLFVEKIEKNEKQIKDFDESLYKNPKRQSLILHNRRSRYDAKRKDLLKTIEYIQNQILFHHDKIDWIEYHKKEYEDSLTEESSSEPPCEF